MPDIVENFSAGLSYVLNSRHIVQSHMAQEIGISSSTLTDYKHGRLRGDETRRERIAELQTNLAYQVEKTMRASGSWGR